MNLESQNLSAGQESAPKNRLFDVRSLRVIVFVALLLRLAYLGIRLWRMKSWSLTVEGFGNEIGNVARSIAAGKGFSSPGLTDTGPTAWFSPVFPYLLAGIFKAFGPNSYASFIVASVMDSIFSATTCIPIFFAAAQFRGRRFATWTAWIWAVYPVAIFLAFGHVWYTVLSGLVGACILWYTLVLSESNRPLAWVGYGLLWGFELMINPSFLSLAPFLWAWLIWEMHKRKIAWFRLASTAALVAVLCCVPWTLRNYFVFHQFIPLRSNFGLELWRYNNDQLLPHPDISPSEHEIYKQMGEMAYMQDKRRKAIQFITTHPALVAKLTSVRFVGIWTGREHPLVEFMQNSKFTFRLQLITGSLMSLLALIGFFVLHREKNPYVWPISTFPIVFPLIYYITLSADVYRHPIDPAIVLLAAAALDHWFKKKPCCLFPREKRRHPQDVRNDVPPNLPDSHGKSQPDFFAPLSQRKMSDGASGLSYSYFQNWLRGHI